MMVRGDWTLPTGNSDGFTATYQSDSPTGETNPCLQLQKLTDANGTNQTRMCYPTSGTINGTTVTGMNSGQVTLWLKFTDTHNTTIRRMGVGFRVSDAARSTFTGYSAVIAYTTVNSQDLLVIYSVSSGTHTILESTALPSNLTQNTWYQFRISWKKFTSALLAIKGEMWNGSTWDAINDEGYIDNAPNADSGSHKVGITTTMLGNAAMTTKTDGFITLS